MKVSGNKGEVTLRSGLQLKLNLEIIKSETLNFPNFNLTFDSPLQKCKLHQSEMGLFFCKWMKIPHISWEKKYLDEYCEIVLVQPSTKINGYIWKFSSMFRFRNWSKLKKYTVPQQEKQGKALFNYVHRKGRKAQELYHSYLFFLPVVLSEIIIQYLEIKEPCLQILMFLDTFPKEIEIWFGKMNKKKHFFFIINT